MPRTLRFVFPSVVSLVLVLLLLPRVAAARDVMLNGIKLDENLVLTNQTFAACEVKFDAQGNIHITAKGFKIAVQASTKEPIDEPPPADGRISRRYFLVASERGSGAAQYDVDVYLNGRLVKKVRGGDGRVAIEVTKDVRAGENRVRFVAAKQATGKRRSSSPTDQLEVVVGEGVSGGGSVSIDRSLATLRVTAADTGPITREAKFTGR
ncbi:MAG: hypothetical protein EXR73_02715 [Myxococcales bacterium]|nr:hypothetical protein [Myxococcales bacterium]